MYKQKVVDISPTSFHLFSGDSKMGSSVGTRKKYNLPVNVSYIIPGDIIRVDGLPFLSRPRLNSHKQKMPDDWMRYKPVQLPTGYWVLRKT